MADPTTLQGFAELALASLATRIGAARSKATAAQAALTAATAALSTATGDYAARGAELTRLRAELAAIPTTADAQPLLDDIDTATIAQRAAEAAMLAAERNVAVERAIQQRAVAELGAAEAAQAQAKPAAKQAALDATRRADLVAALAAAPLATLAADATTLLGSTTKSDAEAAAEKDIPTKLLERARERVTLARERADSRAAAGAALGALIAAHTATHGSTDDKLAPPRAAFDAAVAALTDHVTQAKGRFDRAQATLIRLSAPEQKLTLTAEQVARLNDTDPPVLGPREDAADHESVLDQAQRDLELAQQACDLELVKSDAGAPNTLAAKQAALVVATNARDDASDLYIGDEREAMSKWEAAAPDGVWRDLAACDDADRAATALAASNPAALATALTTTEAALVAALLTASRAHTARDLYETALAARSVESEFDAGAAERIRFAALRGDA